MPTLEGRVNLVDAVVLVALVAAVGAGMRSGVAVQVGFIVGFAVGMALGSLAALVLVGPAFGYVTRSMLTLTSVFGVATALAVAGYRLGRRLRGQVRPGPAGAVGRVGGGIAGGLVLLVGAWFVGATWALGPGVGGLAPHIHGSAVLRAVDAVLPPLPVMFRPIGALIQPAGGPRVFAGFEPTPDGSVDLPTDQEVERTADAARDSTVIVSGPGCGGTLSGSGFAAAEDLVVTNAHVVAGVHEVQVRDGAGEHPAVPVAFDPDLDLAVLEVPDLAAPPLELTDGTVERGATGVALGYPVGMFTARPVAVLARLTAEGHDLYGRGTTRRDVYQLAGDIDDGLSGGPLIGPDGTVIGVIFGRSLVHEGVGYALSMPEVVDAIEEARPGRRVSTAPCID